MRKIPSIIPNLCIDVDVVGFDILRIIDERKHRFYNGFGKERVFVGAEQGELIPFLIYLV